MERVSTLFRYTHTHTHTHTHCNTLQVFYWMTFDLSVSQDTVLTLEALTEYSRAVPRAVLDQDINIRNRKGSVGRVQLTQSRPVASPIQVRVRQEEDGETGLLCFIFSFCH